MHSRKVLLFSVANTTLSSVPSRSSAEERCFQDPDQPTAEVHKPSDWACTASQTL